MALDRLHYATVGCNRLYRICRLQAEVTWVRLQGWREQRQQRWRSASRCPSCGAWQLWDIRLPALQKKRRSRRPARAPLRRLLADAIDPVEHFLPVEPVGVVGAAADRVQAERGHGDDLVGVEAAEEHRSAGIARARTAASVAVALRLDVVAVGVRAAEVDERGERH